MSNMDRNVREVVLGDLPIKAWYPSFYPEELVGRTVDLLYVCPWCFKYTKESAAFLGHTVGGFGCHFFGLDEALLITWSREEAVRGERCPCHWDSDIPEGRHVNP